MEHAVIEDLDRQLLNELQQEFPLSSHPFALIGNNLGISENETLRRVTELSDNGIIRQISAIFDTRRLGYDSCLVAMQLPPQLLDAAAEEINKHQGVSHNYSRSHIFNLWFTIATPPGVDLIQEVRRISNITRPEAVLILPALRVFKIRVQLDVTGNRNPFAMEPLMSQGFTNGNENPVCHSVCHPELVSGSQTRRSRNKFGMTGGDDREAVFSDELS